MIIFGGFYYSTYIKFRGEISSFRQGVRWSILTGSVRLDSVSSLQTYLTSSTGSFGLENLLSQYEHHTIRSWKVESYPRNYYYTGIRVFTLELGYFLVKWLLILHHLIEGGVDEISLKNFYLF